MSENNRIDYFGKKFHIEHEEMEEWYQMAVSELKEFGVDTLSIFEIKDLRQSIAQTLKENASIQASGHGVTG